ncbi:MAG TPA: DUF4383 domain-containing protein [Baekduia sp.]|nr:DUF4383 domain-containing protein [Baekduia sp.]
MASRPVSSGLGTTELRYDAHPAQRFDRIVGPALILLGALGFIASSSFKTGDVESSTFIIFQVNGWHNVVHIASGLLLCLGFGYWVRARTVTLLFGATYLLVALIGWIDGSDVLAWFPVGTWGNILHTVLGVTAIAAGLAPAPARHVIVDSPGRARTGAVRSTATAPGTVATEDRPARGERAEAGTAAGR